MNSNEIDAIASGLCKHLSRRNNDINGCWGIGFLCAHAMKIRTRNFAFKICPGRPVNIAGFELNRSMRTSEKLVKFGCDSVEGRISFFANGRYPTYGAHREGCNISIAITKNALIG